MTNYPDLLDGPIAGVDADALSAASAVVRDYCGWHIAPSVEEIVVVDGPGEHILRLPTLRLTAVSDVTNETAAVADEDVSWSTYGVIENCGCWTRKRRGVTLTITHGFDSCPETLATVVQRIARAGLTGRSAGSVRVGEVQVPVEASPGVVGLDGASMAVLDRYRLSQRP